MPETQVAPTQTAEVYSPEFGTGRYSALMEECFRDAQTVFGLSLKPAEKLARQIASDVGAIMASASVSIKLGKINKDGKLTIAEASKLKGVTMTNALGALKALHFAAEAGTNGFSFTGTKWKPVAWLQKYLADLSV